MLWVYLWAGFVALWAVPFAVHYWLENRRLRAENDRLRRTVAAQERTMADATAVFGGLLAGTLSCREDDRFNTSEG